MGDIERDPDAKPTTDAMTWGERQRLWKDVYKRERERFEQERDEAREQLRGAVDENEKLRTIIGYYIALHGKDAAPDGLRELAASCAFTASGGR